MSIGFIEEALQSHLVPDSLADFYLTAITAQSITMAAINALITRDSVARQLAKRDNWASREPGVVTVFAIVGVGTISTFES